MQTSDPFDLYLRQLHTLGHDRHWMRRNEAALRERYARDPQPFPPTPPPEAGRHDRYGEL